MSQLLRQILDHIPYDTFTDTELFALPGEHTRASRYNQVKRLIAKGDLLHLRRGVYQVHKRYQKRSVNPYTLAGKLYGPSYISFESALSYYGLIPEAVYSITSCCLARGLECETPVGKYVYRHVAQRMFYLGVDRIAEENGNEFLIASPIKALVDYVCIYRLQSEHLDEVLENLRIDKDEIKPTTEELSLLRTNYKSKRAHRFLGSVAQDLTA